MVEESTLLLGSNEAAIRFKTGDGVPGFLATFRIVPSTAQLSVIEHRAHKAAFEWAPRWSWWATADS